MSSNSRHVVDLRSDTISKPTKEMKDSMMTAEIGDDVFGEDPTVNELERYASEITGKEAGLFVVSGTMGNLISVACHCYTRGSEVFIGDQCHIYQYEQGGVAQLCGIIPRTLKNNQDGTFNISDLKAQFSAGVDPHKSVTSLVTVENTINGKVLPINFLKELREAANELQIPVHLDGARLMNAVAAMNYIDPKEITQYVDSANICLSKGLCSPVGSVIVGSKEFIRRARRMRKALGGGMRQAGILAASGLMSLQIMRMRLHQDHQRAKYLANSLLELSPKYISLDINLVHTNMTFFKINENLPAGNSSSAGAEFIRRLLNPTSSDMAVVKAIHVGGNQIRMVFYNDISDNDTDAAITAIKNVFANWN